MEKIREIENLLPGFNCGACGFMKCSSFAAEIGLRKSELQDCPVLNQERFQPNKATLQKLLDNEQQDLRSKITGLIDGAGADFALYPLKDEPSCRETLVCFSSIKPEKETIIRYRPLGCPITHFAKVIEINHGLPDVWVIGPGKLLQRNEKAVEVGICMILSFQGIIKGKMPKVGQTVKFKPAHCMMGKIHSGVVVHLEDDKTRIDCIDLKVWQHTTVDK